MSTSTYIGVYAPTMTPPLLDTLARVLSPTGPPPTCAWYDFCCSDLLPVGGGAPLGTSDPTLFDSSQWHQRCAGSISGLGTLARECSWGLHLGLGMLVCPFPGKGDALDYSLVQPLLQALGRLEEGCCWLCVRIPLSASGDDAGRWRAWHTLRTLSRNSKWLGVCLEVDRNLPSPPSLTRWLSEPVRYAMLPTTTFSTNAAGFPALGPPHRDLITSLVHRGAALCVAGDPPPTLVSHLKTTLEGVIAGKVAGDATSLAVLAATPTLAYAAYLRHALDSGVASKAPLSPQELSLLPWRHTLLSPLQPLADNLTSGTYEVFEADAPKYECYQRALAVILRAWGDAHGSGSGSSGGGDVATILVLGAGRGPLVSRVLAAADGLGIPRWRLRVYALEKNPNAVIHMSARGVKEGWGESVRVVEGDGRVWCPPHPLDILVSELLGSFGDNELSPECLRHAETFLRPDTGVCIPSSYTSFLAPISCAGLWGGVSGGSGGGEEGGSGAATSSSGGGGGGTSSYDVGFVTRMPHALPLSHPLPVFTFHHPPDATERGGGGEGETREISLTFPATIGGGGGGGSAPGQQPPSSSSIPTALHGFAGYFTATLAPGVELSTVPHSHTPSMHSWFPLFLPLPTPVVVECGGGGVITLHLWRCAERGGGRGRVWYQWALQEPCAGPMQNSGGKSWSMLY